MHARLDRRCFPSDISSVAVVAAMAKRGQVHVSDGLSTHIEGKDKDKLNFIS